MASDAKVFTVFEVQQKNTQNVVTLNEANSTTKVENVSLSPALLQEDVSLLSALENKDASQNSAPSQTTSYPKASNIARSDSTQDLEQNSGSNFKSDSKNQGR